MLARMTRSLALVALLALLTAPAAATHGGTSRTFSQTGFTVSGRMLDYWDHNGALPVFGYPLSEARVERNSSGARVNTQYFERQRFEHHPGNGRPYDILLGRLGAELLVRQGRDPGRIPTAQPQAGCRYFPETRHNVCNQDGSTGFWTYWSTHGLDFGEPGWSFNESLALFGYPLTEATIETNSSGDRVLTQWFERARFEWHPGNADPWRVLQGRLGAEILGHGTGQGVVDTVTIFLIAIGQGNVGCNDAVVPLQRRVAPTTTPLRAAMQELVWTEGTTVDGRYNVFDQANLAVESATITGGHAVVRYVGTLALGGACDSPRVKATMQATALQFATVNSVEIFINGIPLDQVLSQQ